MVQLQPVKKRATKVILIENYTGQMQIQPETDIYCVKLRFRSDSALPLCEFVENPHQFVENSQQV